MGESSANLNVKISSQTLDVLFKLEGEHLVEALRIQMGYRLAAISRHLPIELPQLELSIKRLDLVFELADGSILHLEFENSVDRKDLLRFVQYGVALLQEYPHQRILSVVFCGPRAAQTPLPMDFGSLPYRMEFVPIGKQDGEDILAQLQRLVESDGSWSEIDRLNLVLLPLMEFKEHTIEQVVREGMQLAQALPAEEQARAIGALLALAYHYVGGTVFDQLLEGLMSTNLLAQVLEESAERGRTEGRIEGLTEGRTEGQIIGRAEEARALLYRLLERRFGSIPPVLQERIAGLELEELTALFDRAVDVARIDLL